jgi:hypothetical protein
MRRAPTPTNRYSTPRALNSDNRSLKSGLSRPAPLQRQALQRDFPHRVHPLLRRRAIPSEVLVLGSAAPQHAAHCSTVAVIHRRRAGASYATERSLWVTADSSAAALTKPQCFVDVVNRLPCTFCHSLRRWPLDGPCETRWAEGAGRLRRLTGCCARQLKPERRSMSSPPGLPAREVLLQHQGGCP